MKKSDFMNVVIACIIGGIIFAVAISSYDIPQKETTPKQEKQIQDEETQEEVTPKQTTKASICMEIIYTIESSNNPDAVSPTGARGIGQIMKATWDECTEDMQVDWEYCSCWDDEEKNKAVSNYYVNMKIPKYLRYYEIPDTIETRLAAYNCGIGRLKKAYQKYGSQWEYGVPEETQQYIHKYNKYVGVNF